MEPSTVSTVSTVRLVNPDRLLDVVARTGTLVGRTHAGRLLTVGLPDHLAATVAAHEVELVLAVAGRGSGHRWASCTACGRHQLVSGAHRCHLTPKCPGKVPARMKDPQPLAEGLGCARPGCSTHAHHLTAGHEPVCHLDFLHLALRMENPPT